MTERAETVRLRRALQEVLDVEGVLAVAKWCHRAGDPLNLVHYVMALGAAERDTAWWLMNFCEWNAIMSQAQALEYENRSGTRNFFPPRFTMVEGARFAFVGVRNQAGALLDSGRTPDVWKIVELLEKVS
jgi:roadblock/LC7 domain-containing protein